LTAASGLPLFARRNTEARLTATNGQRSALLLCMRGASLRL
jgi:hypothetical protein